MSTKIKGRIEDMVSTGLLSIPQQLLRDIRGAIAMETTIVMLVMVAFLLPIADIGVVVLDYMSAYQAVRNFGAYVQYRPPSDVTNYDTWKNGLTAKAPPGYTITTTVMCTKPDTTIADCTGMTNPGSPKYFAFSTKFTVTTATYLTTLNRDYPITYMERFQ